MRMQTNIRQKESSFGWNNNAFSAVSLCEWVHAFVAELELCDKLDPSL